MTHIRRIAVSALLLLISGGLTFPGSPGLFAADPPADPLPKGAKLRLGTTRMRTAGGWTGALTPDGKYLIAFTFEGLVKYDVTTGEPAGKLGKPMAGFGGGRLEFAADGKRVLSSTFNAATVWEVDTGKTLAKLDRQLPYLDSAASLSADGKVLAVGGVKDEKAKDAKVTAIVWDVEKNQKRAEVTALQNQTVGVALAPDGQTLTTWGTHFEPKPLPGENNPENDPNRVVQFWDAATGKELSRARAEGFGLVVVAFAPDGTTVAVAQGSGIVRLIDPKTGTEKRRLFGRTDQGTRLAFGPDGKTLATAGYDGTVQLWGVADGKRIATVEPPGGPVAGGLRGLVFTAPDRAVAWSTSGSSSAAFVWELPSGKMLSPTGGHTGWVTSIAFTADGKTVLTGGTDGVILRWDAATGKEQGEVIVRSPGTQFAGRLAGGGPTVIAADAKTAVVERAGRAVYDLTTGAQLSSPTTGFGYEVRPFLCADARTLLIVPSPVGANKAPPPKSLKITAWDTLTGTKLAEFESPTGDLTNAAVTPDRSKLVTALVTRPAAGGRAQLLVTAWDLTAGGKKLSELAEPTGFDTIYLAPAPDNKTVLASLSGGKLAVLELATMKASRAIDTGGDHATAAPVFSPDGKSVAVASGSGFGAQSAGTIRVYDWESGKPAKTFKGHAASVSSLAFAPDGKTLATGSHDTTVLIWDLAAAGE